MEFKISLRKLKDGHGKESIANIKIKDRLVSNQNNELKIRKDPVITVLNLQHRSTTKLIGQENENVLNRPNALQRFHIPKDQFRPRNGLLSDVETVSLSTSAPEYWDAAESVFQSKKKLYLKERSKSSYYFFVEKKCASFKVPLSMTKEDGSYDETENRNPNGKDTTQNLKSWQSNLRIMKSVQEDSHPKLNVVSSFEPDPLGYTCNLSTVRDNGGNKKQECQDSAGTEAMTLKSHNDKESKADYQSAHFHQGCSLDLESLEGDTLGGVDWSESESSHLDASLCPQLSHPSQGTDTFEKFNGSAENYASDQTPFIHQGKTVLNRKRPDREVEGTAQKMTQVGSYFKILS
jgi:hypothetical protein